MQAMSLLANFYICTGANFCRLPKPCGSWPAATGFLTQKSVVFFEFSLTSESGVLPWRWTSALLSFRALSLGWHALTTKVISESCFADQYIWCSAQSLRQQAASAGPLLHTLTELLEVAHVQLKIKVGSFSPSLTHSFTHPRTHSFLHLLTYGF